MCDNCKENVKELSQEELEQLENCDTNGENQAIDDRLVELEIEKELIRVEREENAFELIPQVEEDNVSKEINRDAEAYANFYSRLCLSGIHSDVAGQLLLNYMTTRHNIEQAKIDVEKAKFQSIAMQQQL